MPGGMRAVGQAWEPILSHRLDVSVGVWEGERERSTPTPVTALPTPRIGSQKQSQFQIIVFIHVLDNESEDVSWFLVWEIESSVLFTQHTHWADSKHSFNRCLLTADVLERMIRHPRSKFLPSHKPCP